MITALTLTATLAAGAATWTFTEYALHNWVGHLGRGKNHFSRVHLQHHVEGDYFVENWQKVLFGFILGIPLWAGAAFVGGALAASSYTLGFIVMYCVYEYIHWSLHAFGPSTAYGRWARKHHFFHHFHNPTKNHGVTSFLWDVVFRTHLPVDVVVEVPRHKAMVWLIDPETDAVRPEYAADYRAVGALEAHAAH
jgi:hypothetical protein